MGTSECPKDVPVIQVSLQYLATVVLIVPGGEMLGTIIPKEKVFIFKLLFPHDSWEQRSFCAHAGYDQGTLTSMELYKKILCPLGNFSCSLNLVADGTSVRKLQERGLGKSQTVKQTPGTQPRFQSPIFLPR